MSITSFSKFLGASFSSSPFPSALLLLVFLLLLLLLLEKKIKTVNVPLFICAVNNHKNIYDKSFCLRSLCRLFLINHSLRGRHISLLGSLKKKPVLGYCHRVLEELWNPYQRTPTSTGHGLSLALKNVWLDDPIRSLLTPSNV